MAAGATEVNICLEGTTSGTGFCPNGVFIDNISVSGVDLNLIPDADHPDICIENMAGSTTFGWGLSCAPLRFQHDHGCTTPTIEITGGSESTIGGFGRIYNTLGDCAISVDNSQLTIDGRSSSAPRIYSNNGLAFRAAATSSSPGDPHVEIYSGSIEESVVGLVLRGHASFAGNDTHFQGHSEIAVEAMESSSLLLVDSSLEDNNAVAWFCDSTDVVMENVGIVNNPTPVVAALTPGVHGIWLKRHATLDAFNIIAHSNNFSGNDVGFVYLRDDSELSLASSTFVDNEAAYEIQWLDSTRVDILDTIFHDTTVVGVGGWSDSLFCYSSMPSTADYVNGFGYLHGDGIGPFSAGTSVWSPTGPNCFLTNNTSVDPIFATGTWNKYYLNQASSPMIDAGSDDAENIYDFLGGDWTTDPHATSPASDYGTPVDLGYHQLPPP